MNIIITPPQVIQVKVGTPSPATVPTTTTYFGSTGELPLINFAASTANTALIQANTAQSQVGAAYAEANASYLAANTAQMQVGAAYAEANASYMLAANSLPISGGTVAGNLTIGGQLYGNLYLVDAGMF